MANWLWNFLFPPRRKTGAKIRFELKVKGITPERLIEINGPNGVFYIATAGGGSTPEMDCYFYGDLSAQFFYYASNEFIPKNGSIVTVHRISSERFSGVNLVFEGRVGRKVSENLTWLFKNRVLDFPGINIHPDAVPVSVIFRGEFFK